MSKQLKTELHKDIETLFATETIPFFSKNPEWRNLFYALANLSEDMRAYMLQQLEDGAIPSGLVPGEKLSTAMDFLRLNLGSPVGPCMMVRMIDRENLRAQKSLRDHSDEIPMDKPRSKGGCR